MNATELNANESVSGAEGAVSRTPEGLILEEITNTVTQFTVEDILQRLRAFAQSLKQPTRSSGDQTANAALPTVGIIGMGRCGTNIAIDLANLVYEQRKIGIKELSRRARTMTKRPSPTEYTSESGQSGSANGKTSGPSFWQRLFGEKSDRDQVFLVDPVILTADLDGDTTQRIKVANPTLTQGALRFG